MAKTSRPLIYGGILVIAVVAFVMSEPKSSDDGGRSRDRGGVTNGRDNPEFGPEDYNAEFVALNESPNNAFMPIVKRVGRNTGGIEPNEFPAAYAGGEVGWFYTGTVVIDDVPSALVENELTGDGMYLEVGEYLKRTTILEIAPTYIVVKGMTGKSLRLDLLRDLREPGDEFDGLFDGLEIAPVRPDLSGVLGGPIRLPDSPDTSEQS